MYDRRTNQRDKRPAYHRQDRRKVVLDGSDRRAYKRPDPKTLPGYLRRLRGVRPLRDVAARMGINEAYLWQLENGKRGIPRPDTLTKIAIGYGIDPALLLQAGGYLITQDYFFKKIDEMRSARVFMDYQELSEEGKKKVESYLQFLRKEEKLK